MALKSFSCPCGQTFDDLVGAQFSGSTKCPSCGRADVTEQFSPCSFAFSTGFDYDSRPLAEIQDQLKQKAYIEKNADQVRSGAMKYRTPKGLPEALTPRI